jgi:signal transduction histidine kinase/CheY-like chemotaxis protein
VIPQTTRWGWLLRWTNYFVTDEVRRRGPTAVTRATALVLASPVLVLVTLAPVVGVILEGMATPVDPAVLAIFAAGFAATPFVLRWTSSPNAAGAWLMIVGLIATFIPTYFQQGLGSILVIWFLLAPVVASFFLGSRLSLLIAGVAAVSITSLWLLESLPAAFPPGFFRDEDPGFRWLNLMLGLLVISTLALFWEISAERAQRERERLEAQVRHSEKLETVGLLAGGIAHDFNNILAAILGHASLLEGDVREPDQQRRLAAIVGSCKRGSGLVNQMLAYAGRSQTRIDTVEIDRVVREVVELLRPALAKNTELILDCDPHTPPLTGDPVQIQQLVMNLITNASEALEGRRGRVWITTGRVDLDAFSRGSGYLGDEHTPPPDGRRFVFLEVRDEGCGIASDKLDAVFDPFFTTKPTGRGLGLAAVIGTIRKHQGDVEVESEVGRGTRFRVLLPATDDDRSAVPSASSTRPASTPRRRETLPDIADASDIAASESSARSGERIGELVLVVDDEPLVRELAAEVLERAGLRTLVAADGDEGLALFQAHGDAIALVVLDRTMPGLDGLELLERLRMMRPDLPVILSSGYAEDGDSTRLRELGVDAVLHKPWSPRDLVETAASLGIANSAGESGSLERPTG